MILAKPLAFLVESVDDYSDKEVHDELRTKHDEQDIEEHPVNAMVALGLQVDSCSVNSVPHHPNPALGRAHNKQG